MKNKKLWLRISLGLVIALVIIDIVAGFFFYNLAIERNVKKFLNGNADLEVSAETMDVLLDGGWRDWSANQDYEVWQMESFDGLTLQGYYLEAKEPTDKTVVFAHGYLGRGNDMALFGEHYYEKLGYNMFTADMRGHGKSEGDYVGFGWHDRMDYVDWIDRIIAETGEDTEIILHGVSMGAATVLMASGEDLPVNVKAIVADSPYTAADSLFAYQLDRMFNLPAFPILPTLGVVTDLRAGYTPKEASALNQVKKTDTPILYIHGEEDTFVPTDMTEELFNNTKSEARMVIYEDSNHGESFVKHREEYIAVLEDFLEDHID